MVLVASAAAACDDGMSDLGQMSDQIDEARRENARHLEVARLAPDVQTIVADLDRHDGMMDEAMGGMHGGMDMMSDHCGGAGMASTQSTMEAMHDEMAGHLVSLWGPADLEAGRTVCEGHFAAMDSMLDSMADAMARSAACDRPGHMQAAIARPAAM